MRNVLVWAHHHKAATVLVDAAHGIDIFTGTIQSAKCFFVVTQTVPAFVRKQELGHGGNCQCMVALLEHSAHVKYRIYISASWGVALDWGICVLAQIAAQLAKGGVWRSCIALACKCNQAPAAIGCKSVS